MLGRAILPPIAPLGIGCDNKVFTVHDYGTGLLTLYARIW
jgi:hypothetical protein